MPDLIVLFRELSIFAKLTMALALAVFGLAGSYAFRPAEHKLTLMRPVSLATIFATLSGLFSGWINVLVQIAASPDGRLPTVSVYRGIAESLVLGFVCFGFLAASWLLAAVGMFRRSSVTEP